MQCLEPKLKLKAKVKRNRAEQEPHHTIPTTDNVLYFQLIMSDIEGVGENDLGRSMEQRPKDERGR